MVDVTSKQARLDLKVLEECTGGDRDLMRELSILYVSDADLQLRAIDDALSMRDHERIRRIAHNLMIASEGIGANAAADVFRELEEQAKGGQAELLAATTARGQEEFERVRKALDELR